MAVLVPRPTASTGSPGHHHGHHHGHHRTSGGGSPSPGVVGSVSLLCSNLPSPPPPAPSLVCSSSSPAGGSGDAVQFQLKDIDLAPGPNRFTLSQEVSQVGYYVGRQLDLRWEQLSLAQLTLSGAGGAGGSTQRPPAFTVYYDSPRVALRFPQGELLAGVRQQLEVVLTCGSLPLTPEHRLHLKASRGLLLRPSPGPSEPSAPSADSFCDECRLPVGEPGVTADGRAFSLLLQAPLGPSSSPSTHQLALAVEGPEGEVVEGSSQTVALHFLAPFACTHRLQTCGQRKYVQVSVQGLTSQPFTVGNASLIALEGEGEQEQAYLKPLFSSSQLLRVSPEQAACFLWELLNAGGQPLRLSFSMLYAHGPDRTENSFTHLFRLHSYQTLYSVRARVEPLSGAEFCRTDCACSLHVHICQLHESSGSGSTGPSALMYELVPDASTWAVLGRTAGVLQLGPEQREQTVTLEVKPLQVGFLPMPSLRLSRYIPPASSCSSPSNTSSATGGTASTGTPSKGHHSPANATGSEGSSGQGTAKLEPFLPGQVYNWTRAMQVHVLAPSASSCEPPG